MAVEICSVCCTELMTATKCQLVVGLSMCVRCTDQPIIHSTDT